MFAHCLAPSIGLITDLLNHARSKHRRWHTALREAPDQSKSKMLCAAIDLDQLALPMPYSRDEIVKVSNGLLAEIPAPAFELEPRPDHAAYLASWLEVLSNDRRTIFSAAAHAQRAIAYLHSLQPHTDHDREAA